MRHETIGNCSLYLGDCAEMIPQVEAAMQVVTDPPYGLGKKLAGGGAKKWKGMLEKLHAWDTSAPQHIIDMLIDKYDICVIWGGNYFTLPPSRKWIIWDKGGGMRGRSFADGEMAWCSFDGNMRIITMSPHPAFSNGADRVHPTQKPVALMKRCIAEINTPTHIFDPFMGSGSTGVACIEMGIPFTGIERDEEYFNMACHRMREALKQQTLL